MDEWVQNRRQNYLSYSQLQRLKPADLSINEVSRRTVELSYIIPLFRFPAPVQGAFVDLDNKKVRKIQAVYENCGRKATGWRFSVDAWGLFFFF